jgi:Fe-S cluster assembly protein SufD
MSGQGWSLTEQDILMISEHNQDPDWLKDRRRQAYLHLSQTDFTYKSDSPILKNNLSLSAEELLSAKSAPGLKWSLPKGSDSYQILAKDSLASDWPNVFKENLFSTMRIDESADLSFHQMLVSDVLLLYIPKGLRLSEPVYIQTQPKESQSLFTHVLVVADEGSEVNILHDQIGEYGYLNQAVEIVAKFGAKVNYVSLQEFDPSSQAYILRRARVEDKAEVQWVNVEIGGGYTHSDTQTYLLGNGAKGSGLVLLFTDHNERLDTGILMEHEGERTVSDIIARGVLKGQSRCVYRVLSDIKHGAKDAVAYQKLKAALLSEEAKIETVPGLEIKESQVQAGHSAGISQVEEEQIFYLMTRGLSRQEATNLIIQGFFHPVLEKISPEGIKDRIKGVLDRKMDNA